MTESPATPSVMPFDSAGSMQEANTRLLQALNARLAGRQGIEDRNDALRAIRSEIEVFLARGAATGARMEEQRQRTAAQVQLDYWASVLDHAGVPTQFQRLVDFDAQSLPILDDASYPFAGLEAIDRGERLIGRERAVESLVQRLADTRLVVVQGSSGSGKTSLVMAGAVPVWLGRAGPRPRLVGPVRPGKDVLLALAQALRPDAEPARLAEAVALWRRDPAQLIAVAGGLESPPLLVVIEAFQEVFTQCAAADAQALAAGLADLLRRRPADRVVFILREEFSRHLEQLDALRPFLAEHAAFSMREWPMGFQELKSCVEEPAAGVNLQFAPGLVDHLVRGVLQRDSALLLLQFALRRLWAKRDRNRITWATYKAMGGDPVGIVEQFAEAAANAIGRSFPDDRRAAARETLLRLWADLVGVDPLFNAYRLSLRWQELVDGPEGPWRGQVLHAMEREGLLLRRGAQDDPQAILEIHDEALLQYWSQGQKVVARKLDSARRRVALTEAAQLWDLAGRPARKGLLPAWQLHELESLPDPTSLERSYLETSRRVLNRARILRRVTYIGTGVAVTALVALGVLVRLMHGSNDRMELSRQIQSAATAVQEGNLGFGLDQVVSQSARVLGLATDDELTFEARAALAAVHRQTDDVQHLLFDRTAVLRAVAFQPGSSPHRLLAYGGTGGQVHLARPDEARPDISLRACEDGVMVTSIAFDAAGARLAAACADGKVFLWSVATGNTLGERVPVSRLVLWTVAFSPDGLWLAAAGLDDHVYTMPITATGLAPSAAPQAWSGPAQGIWSLAFSPTDSSVKVRDSSVLVGDGRGLLLRCGPLGAKPGTCQDTTLYAAQKADSIRAIVVSPDQKHVAIGHWNGSVELRDAKLEPADPPLLRSRRFGPVLSLAFHGRCHLAVGTVGGLQYWTLPERGNASSPVGDCADLLDASVGDEVFALADDRASGRLAVATRGGYVAVLEPERRHSRLRTTVPVDSRLGQQLRGTVLRSSDREALLLAALRRHPDGSKVQPIRVLLTPLGPRLLAGTPQLLVSGEIWRLVADPSGKHLAALSCDGETNEERCRVTVWTPPEPARDGEPFALGPPTLTLTQAEHFGGHPPSRIALSPDGTWMAVAFPVKREADHLTPRENGMAQWALVNLKTGVTRTIPSELASVREIAFNADGSLFAAGGDTLDGIVGRDEVRLWEMSRSGAALLKRERMQVSAFSHIVMELVFAEERTQPWPARLWRRHAAPQVLAGGENGEVDAWSVETGKPRTPVWLAIDDVWLLAHEPRSGMLAASDKRHVLRVWDPRAPHSGTVVLSQSAQNHELPGWLAFDPKGRWLVSGAVHGAYGEVNVWDLDVASLRRNACMMFRWPGDPGAATETPDGPCSAIVR